MKRTFAFILGLSLLFASCGDGEATTKVPVKMPEQEAPPAEPFTYPFGFELSDFAWTGHREGCGGDCCHSSDAYENASYTIISDTLDCWEYNQYYVHYLFENDRLIAVHEFRKDMEDLADGSYTHSLQERTIDFKEERAFVRRDTVASNFKGWISTEFAPEEFDQKWFKAYSENVIDPREEWSFKSAKDFTISGDYMEAGRERNIHLWWASGSDEGVLITQANNYMKLTDYASRDIPKNAVFAFSTWWAGGGDIFYGVLNKGVLQIFQRWEEEMAETDDEYKLYLEIDPNIIIEKPDHYIVFKENSGERLMQVAFNDKDEALYMKYKGDIRQKALQKKADKSEGSSLKIYYNVLVMGVPKESCSIAHDGNWDYLSYQTAAGKMLNFTIDHEKSVVNDAYRKLPLF